MDELQPRGYQQEMEQHAIAGNTIIHLPTGSGKTFIAGQLLKRFKKDTLVPLAAGGKRSFFLVNTVALVYQQEVLINSGTVPLKVKAFSSENKVDFWKKDRWMREFEEGQVIVMTSQILLDVLQHGYFSLSQINLLIFDECHHAVNDHPMRQIMRQFENYHESEQPRVLGLTATLLNRNVKKENVEAEIHNLEITFHSKVATVSSLQDVFLYSTNPKEFILRYLKWDTTPLEKVFVILQHSIKIVKACNFEKVSKNSSINLGRHQQLISAKTINDKIINNIKNVLKDMEVLGCFGTSYSLLYRMIQYEILKRKVDNVTTQTFLHGLVSAFSRCRNIIENLMSDKIGFDKIWHYSSDKIRKLYSIILEYNPDFIKDSHKNLSYNIGRSQLSGLIFTTERFMAKIVSSILKEFAKCNEKDFGFVKSDFVVGSNVNPFNCTRDHLYESKKSHLVLQKFRNGLINCLLTTNVMEEGIDIPTCTLVVKFDQVMEYRSYIQSKGRARDKASSFVMMTDKEAFVKNLKGFHETEEIINNMLVGKSDLREAPTSDVIRRDLYDQEIEPYIIGNAKVTMTSAIQLLNRYCANLPQDKFTILQPDWVLQRKRGLNEDAFKIIIHFPISCSVKQPIEGPFMNNQKSAKRATALLACIYLHKCGELSDNLLPHNRTEQTIIDSMKDIFFSHWPENDNSEGLPKAGTKGRRRIHPKMYPKALKGQENNGSVCSLYIHAITMTPVPEGFPLKDHQDRALFNALCKSQSYAILTASPIPKICDFPLFLSCGEVQITIHENDHMLTIDREQFNEIKRYHCVLFGDILNTSKPFLVSDERGDNSYFIVPTFISSLHNLDVDWNLIYATKSIEPVEQPTDDARKRMEFRGVNYEMAIVTPWYRGDTMHSRYLVVNVLDGVTPFSSFPNDNFITFDDYYKSKYNLSVLGPKSQSLLEVKLISGRMNSLLPRAATIYANEDDGIVTNFKKRDDDAFMPFNELLIPEYCSLMSYPGYMWLKATVLPSLLHRMTMLLQAEELRSYIAQNTSLGVVSGTNWKPLTVDMIAVRLAHKKSKGIESKPGYPKAQIPLELDALDADANDELEDEDMDSDISKIKVNEQLTGDERLASQGEALFITEERNLDKEYPWDPSTEPLDLDRNILSVRLMDIECHVRFMIASNNDISNIDAKISPVKEDKLAICAPPSDYLPSLFLFKNTMNKIGPQLSEILMALTTITSQDSINMERMEVLGDSFLKFATSLFLFDKFPKFDEGRLTAIKSQIIGNRNLYYCGSLFNLGGRIKVDKFSALSDWLSPAFKVPDKIENVLLSADLSLKFLRGINFNRAEVLKGDMDGSTWKDICNRLMEIEEDASAEPTGLEPFIKRQSVRDKVVADCVEALIGVYLYNCGVKGALKLLSYIKVLPEADSPELLMTKTSSTPFTRGECTSAQIDFLLDYGRQEIEQIIGYHFKDPSLLLQALSHPSYNRNRVTDCYQRLEFLGDAVLDLLVSVEIFERNQTLTPGEITDLRSALVNNVTFACFTVRHGLFKYLQSTNPQLEEVIMRFVKSRKNDNDIVNQETLFLLEEDGVNISSDIEVPKALGDIFESLAGAIFLDSGRSLETVWRIFRNIMIKEIELFSKDVPKQSIRMLYEMVHAAPLFLPVKKLEDVNRVMVPLTIKINRKPTVIHGFGKNKAQAKLAAAKMAIRLLRCANNE